MADIATWFRAGVNARDLSVKADECPYDAREAVRYWQDGWHTRDAALARWERQADEVDDTLVKAAPFINRGTPAGQTRPSDLIGLHFYALGSTEPDKAYAWFRSTMQVKRAAYLKQGATAS